jgi:hypothetical protein
LQKLLSNEERKVDKEKYAIAQNIKKTHLKRVENGK